MLVLPSPGPSVSLTMWRNSLQAGQQESAAVVLGEIGLVRVHCQVVKDMSCTIRVIAAPPPQNTSTFTFPVSGSGSLTTEEGGPGSARLLGLV
jgi:hypothetical protein